MGFENRDYYRDEYNARSTWRPTSTSGRSMVTTLILINIGIFVLDMFSGPYVPAELTSGIQGDSPVEQQLVDEAKSQSQINNLMRFLALEPDVYKRPWNFWQLLTHGFAHSSINSESSIFHIASNMIVLFFLGRPLEQRMGSSEFLKFYLIAIVVSGIGFVVLNIGGPNIPAVGASGAVSAVLALFIFLYPKQTLLLFGVIPMPAWVLGVFVILTDVMRAFDPGSMIAWQSHLTGFAFGALYFYMQWNFSWIRLDRITDWFKSRPKLKVHRAAAADDQLQRQADEILEKINQQGEESLSARERRILKKYSEKIRSQRH